MCANLCHLLRAAIQDTYVVPMQEVRGLLSEFSVTIMPPCIDYSFPDSEKVQVDITQGFQVKVEVKRGVLKRKSSDTLSFMMKNTLTTTLKTLSQWESAIDIQVPQGCPEQLKNKLIEGGFTVGI